MGFRIMERNYKIVLVIPGFLIGIYPKPHSIIQCLRYSTV